MNNLSFHLMKPGKNGKINPKQEEISETSEIERIVAKIDPIGEEGTFPGSETGIHKGSRAGRRVEDLDCKDTGAVAGRLCRPGETNTASETTGSVALALPEESQEGATGPASV